MVLGEQVAEVLAHSQGFSLSEMNVNPLLDKWFVAKSKYINRWGGDLIKEIPNFSIELSYDERQALIDEFVDWIARVLGLEDLANFINENGVNAFFENKVVKASEKAKEGEKLVRAFRHFISDPKVLDKAQTKASMIIQEGVVTGTLCLSVHPLDYLSSSENAHNWRSCHSLDGEYRAGNLSYMVDSSTLVCYLKSETDKPISRFPSSVPWNSKKWRMLVFMSQDGSAMFAGRQYPFSTDPNHLLPYILSLLGEKVGRWTNFHNDSLKEFNFKDGTTSWMWSTICMKDQLVPTHYLIKEPEDVLFFNDLLRSTCYKPYYAWRRSLVGLDFRDFLEEPMFRIGEEVPCPICGKGRLVNSEIMCCVDCFNEMYPDKDRCSCVLCGSEMQSQEAHMTYNFLHPEWNSSDICDECFDCNADVYICENCGTAWYDPDKEHEDPFICPFCSDDSVED